MTERFINPVRQRFQRVLPSVLSQFDKERDPKPPPKPKAPREEDKADDGWEMKSLHYFNDFLSIDQDSLAESVLRVEGRKNLTDQWQQPSSSPMPAAVFETEALQDTLLTRNSNPEELQEKLRLVDDAVRQIWAMLREHYPVSADYFDPFSYHTLALMKQQAFKDHILMHIAFLHFMAERRTDILRGEDYLYLQMFLWYLDISLSIPELDRQWQKFVGSVQGVRLMVQQSVQYLKLNITAFQMIETTLRERSQVLLPYFLKRVQREKLNLGKRLALKNLENRSKNLHQQLVLVNKQLKQLEKSQQSPAAFLGEKAALIGQWRRMEYDMSCIFTLFCIAFRGYPLPVEDLEYQMTSIGVNIQNPLVQERLKGFSLEELERLCHDMALYQQWEEQPRNSVAQLLNLGSEQRQLMLQNELRAIYEWACYKNNEASRLQQLVAYCHAMLAMS